jgi:hypothetical protein
MIEQPKLPRQETIDFLGYPHAWTPVSLGECVCLIHRIIGVGLAVGLSVGHGSE